MSKRTKLKWKELHVLRKVMSFTQEKWGQLIGMSQSAVSIHEKKHADDYVDPEVARKAVEGSIGAHRKAAERVAEVEPGSELIELVPIRRVAGKLFRMFIAVPKAWLSPEDGRPPPSPVPASEELAGSGSPDGAAISRTRTAFRWIAVGQALMVCLCVAILGVVLALYRDSPTGARGGRSPRVARDAKIDRPAVPPSPKAPEETDEREPSAVPGEVYSDGASDQGGDSEEAKGSIKLPKKPYSWQKVAPCDRGETEKEGGCWFGPSTNAQPPCPEYAVEDEHHQCLMPVPAKPKAKRPNTVQPKH